MEKETELRDSLERRGVPIIREKSHEMLAEIVKRLQPKKILEIGTAVGYSGILMLEASKDSELITIEHDHAKVVEAKENFSRAGLENRVNIIEDDCSFAISMLALDEAQLGTFDFIFLDGPKAQYVKMLENLLMLTKHGGTILADNVLFRGWVENKKEMPKRFRTIVKRLEMFLDVVKMHPKIESHKLYKIEDGMLEILVR